MGDHDHHNHHHHGHQEMTTVMPQPNEDAIRDDNNAHFPGHDHSQGSNSHEDHNMMMRMYFHPGEEETILFSFWKISDIGGLLASMVAVFVLAFSYEALKFYREHLYRHSFQTVQYNTVSLPVENGGCMKETHKTVQLSSSNSTSLHQIIQPELNSIFISQTTCNCSPSNNVWEGKGHNASNNNCLPRHDRCGTSSSSSSPTPSRLPTFHRAYKVKMFSWMHGWQTFLHVVQVVLSYFLMLIFMTYNIWLCLAVAVGAGVGYFFVGWKKSLVVDITEHCH